MVGGRFLGLGLGLCLGTICSLPLAGLIIGVVLTIVGLIVEFKELKNG